MIFVLYVEEVKVVLFKVYRVFIVKIGSVKFDFLDWESFLMFYYVILRLVEILIYEVVGGKVVEGFGVFDVLSVWRID